MQVNSPCFYEAFGLGIRANGPLPGFREGQTREVDLEIEWSDRPVEDVEDVEEGGACNDEILYTSAGRTADGAPFFTVGRPHDATNAYLRCRHSSETGRGCFEVEASGRRVVISATPGLAKADLMAYLAGPVMGCVLRLRGFTCLHAAVVIIKGRAVALMGPKGSGKSTLAAALAERGYPVLTDDIAAISEDNGCLKVQPAYPRLRLWPESQEFVPELSMDALPRVLSSMEKRYQPLTALTALTGDGSSSKWRFSTRSSPLAALYVLGSSSDNTAHVTATSRAQAIMILKANTYAGYLEDNATRRRDFQVLGSVASRAAVCIASGPHGLEGFRRRCARIIEHIESLP
jgi:hypothetical protein